MASEKLNGHLSVQSINSQILKASPVDTERLFVVIKLKISDFFFPKKTTEINDVYTKSGNL